MAQALDNIFSAIIKSEMIAEIEKKKHKEVKDGIKQLQMKLQKQECLKAEHLTKKRQLELAIADTNIGMKLFKVREEMLTKELTVITKKAKLEKSNYDEINRDMADLCTEFVQNVSKFSIDYGTSSSGVERRIHSAKDCLRLLESDKDSLELDIKRAIEINDTLERLLDDKSNRVDELKAIQCQIDDVDKDICLEMAAIKDFEKKISQLITEPDCGMDFTKMKEELQEYEVADLQSQINQLHIELKSLTGKLHRKEAQTLQQQYRKWQRQQHLKSQNSCKKELSFCPEPEQSSSATVIKESFSQDSDTMDLIDLTVIPNEPVKIEEETI